MTTPVWSPVSWVSRKPPLAAGAVLATAAYVLFAFARDEQWQVYVGGLLLGLLEAFAAGYLSSQYKDAVAFLVILIVLFAMPRGLFGRASVERV